jgi:hypothetical protein
MKILYAATSAAGRARAFRRLSIGAMLDATNQLYQGVMRG